MRRTDYHMPGEINESVVSINANKIEDNDEETKLKVFILNDTKEYTQKKLSKVFDDEIKISIKVLSEVPKKSYVDVLFSNTDDFKESFYYSHVASDAGNKPILFITDVRKWYKKAKKHHLLLNKLLKSKVYWDVFDINHKEDYGDKTLFLENCMRAGVVMTTSNIGWSNGVLFNDSFIKNVQDADINSFHSFSLTSRNDENYPIVEFDYEKYINLNFDLTSMKGKEATTHFIEHGWLKEARSFYYPDIPSSHIILPPKSSKPLYVLLNHSSSLSGAPWVLYNLFLELYYNNDVEVIVLTPDVNYELFNKVGIPDNIPEYPIVCFHNNPEFIKKALKKLEPTYLVVNSFASEFLYLKDEFSKYNTVQYVHEAYDTYIPNQVSVDIDSKLILCADHKTEQSFEDSDLKAKVYPPKFRESTFDNIQDVLPVYNILDVWSMYRFTTRKVIGMVGTPCERKNYNLFLEIAKYIPEYDFVWVGGNQSFRDDNLMVVAKTPYATSFIAQFDIFFLSSDEDLCPVVLLEALALNIQSMVFQKNIGYEHDKSQHINIFNRNISDLSLKSIKKKINSVLDKVINTDLPSGNKYIKDNFVYKKGEFIKLVEKKIET